MRVNSAVLTRKDVIARWALPELATDVGEYSLDVLQGVLQAYLRWGQSEVPDAPLFRVNCSGDGIPGHEEWNKVGDWWRSRLALVVLQQGAEPHRCVWMFDAGTGYWWDMDIIKG